MNETKTDLISLPASPVRSLGNGRVGGYLVMFSPGGEPRDAYGTYFEQDTEFGWQPGDGHRLALYEHGMDETLGTRSIGGGLELRRVDDVGLWVELQLDLADEYERAIYEQIIPTGKMGLSSGTAEHLIDTAPDGKQRRWIIAEGSLTVMPAEPRTRGVCHLRDYQPVSVKSLLSESPGGAQPGASERGVQQIVEPAQKRSAHKPNYSACTSRPKTRGGNNMFEKLIALIKAQLGNLSEEDTAKLDAIIEAYLAGQDNGAPVEPLAAIDGDDEPDPETLVEIAEMVVEMLQNDEEYLSRQRSKPGKGARFEPPAGARRTAARPPFENRQPSSDARQAEVVRAAHVLRFGELDAPTDLVMREVYAGDYRQAIHDQNQAFRVWLRTGQDSPHLHKQLWSADNVRSMLRDGLSVSQIRATMVEGMDELGGYAVPPDRQAEIVKRLVGLTAIRGGGARVIQTASNMIEWVQLTGGNSRYTGNIRGVWGDETTSGTAQNQTLGLLQIPVNIYSYPVDVSRSLLEDATNLEAMLMEEIADALAIDEDAAFLVGEGNNKPLGILPGSANSLNLTPKALSLNGTGSDLTIEGVKGLRRGVASQYRARERATWIGNSATAEVIELFQDGMGRFYFEYVDAGERFMGSAWRESEAMPDVGANTFPIIFGDLSGYAIVERLGMSIDRFHDSNTGAKKFRFEVYRRIGGRVIEPWKLAVGKVATSV